MDGWRHKAYQAFIGNTVIIVFETVWAGVFTPITLQSNFYPRAWTPHGWVGSTSKGLNTTCIRRLQKDIKENTHTSYHDNMTLNDLFSNCPHSQVSAFVFIDANRDIIFNFHVIWQLLQGFYNTDRLHTVFSWTCKFCCWCESCQAFWQSIWFCILEKSVCVGGWQTCCVDLIGCDNIWAKDDEDSCIWGGGFCMVWAKGAWDATWEAFLGGPKLVEFCCPGYELLGKHPPVGGPRGGSGLEKVKPLRRQFML